MGIEKKERSNTKVSIENISEGKKQEVFEPNKKIKHEGDKVIIDFNKISIIHKSEGMPEEIYNWDVKNKLGEGSFAQVYKVTHIASGLTRAMKVIQKQDQCPLKEKEILNEFELLKQIDHPNILKIYEYFNTPEHIYLIIEYCPGGELFNEIIKKGPFDEKFSVSLMYQLLKAVYYLHNMNIVHRDIKPENILVEGKEEDGNLRIKLIDFGFATILNETKKDQKIVGSLFYVAPEVLMNNFSEKSDLWSCGVIMYILLSGYCPFQCQTEEETYEKVLSGKFDFNHTRWDNKSEEAKVLINNLLEKNSAKRISAEYALIHPWFNMFNIRESFNKLDNETIERLLTNLKNFKADFLLQKVAMAYLIHNFSDSEDLNQVYKLFNLIDEKANGKISREELFNGLNKYLNNPLDNLKEQVDIIFDIVDSDKDNWIGCNEFARAAIDKEKILTDDMIKYAFSYLDRTSSGDITLEEIQAHLQRWLGKIPDIDQVSRKVLKEMDLTKDGRISYEEFKTTMRKVFL